MARETTGTLGRPVLRALQALPPSVLLKTPSRSTPTYMVVGVWGSMARALMAWRVVRMARLQEPAPAALLKISTPLARQATERRVGDVWATAGSTTEGGVGGAV